jgi:hypothetical protein
MVEVLVSKGADINTIVKSELLRMQLMMMAMTMRSISMIAMAFAFDLMVWCWAPFDIGQIAALFLVRLK